MLKGKPKKLQSWECWEVQAFVFLSPTCDTCNTIKEAAAIAPGGLPRCKDCHEAKSH